MILKPARQPGALLTDAPLGFHFAQLHRDPRSRVESAVAYLGAALRRGSGALLVAEPANAEAHLAGLGAAGMRPESYRRSGQLEILDADAAVGRIMREGVPDRAVFKATVGPALDRLQAFGGKGVRACCEMGNILWHRGEVPAALVMEQFWDDVTSNRRLTHFCSYLIDHRHPGSYAYPIHEIGRAHSDIVPTADDARFHEALDAASRDLFGIPLSELVNLADQSARKGEERLPPGHRTVLWVMRHLPDSSTALLERARRHAEN